METINSDPKVIRPESEATAMWHTQRQLLMVASFLGLIAMNILTLVNDNIHAAGFNLETKGGYLQRW